MGEFKRTYRYDILVGLSDRDSRREEAVSKSAIKRISAYFSGRDAGFSIHQQAGGYVHDDTSFLCERSLDVRLIDADENDVREVAGILRELLNQEAVLIRRSTVEVMYL